MSEYTEIELLSHANGILDAALDQVDAVTMKMYILSAQHKLGVERIAIMAALNLSHELLNAKSGNVDVGDIKRRISQMQDQIDKACASK